VQYALGLTYPLRRQQVESLGATISRGAAWSMMPMSLALVMRF
jgi:hypothetical protein